VQVSKVSDPFLQRVELAQSGKQRLAEGLAEFAKLIGKFEGRQREEFIEGLAEFAKLIARFQGRQREEFIEEIEAIMSADGVSGSEPSATQPPTKVATSASANSGTKTDQAEQLVMAQPGITSRRVGEMIGRSRKAASNILSAIVKTRGSIENRDGGWHPVAKKPPKGGQLRRSIVELMDDEVGRGTGEIIKAIRARDPDVNRNSINAQVARMRHTNPPLLVQVGDGEHGPVYKLDKAALAQVAEAD